MKKQTDNLEIVQRATEIVLPALKNAGLILWDVEYKKEGIDYVLRIFIDKDGGEITLDDCEKISREISELLDREGFVEDAYYLEVSSPGVERKLRAPEHFLRSLGKKIQFKWKNPEGTKQKVIGTLKEYKDGEITILLDDGGEVNANAVKCENTRLYFDFAEIMRENGRGV